MNRLTDAVAGEVIFEGRDIVALKGAEKRAWQSNCVMIFPRFNLAPRMDVISNVLPETLNKRSTFTAFFNLFPQEDSHCVIDILYRSRGRFQHGDEHDQEVDRTCDDHHYPDRPRARPRDGNDRIPDRPPRRRGPLRTGSTTTNACAPIPRRHSASKPSSLPPPSVTARSRAFSTGRLTWPGSGPPPKPPPTCRTRWIQCS